MYNNKHVRFIVSAAPFLISLVSSTLAHCFDILIITIPADDSFHFNLITVNALFGGFLYTNYSLLFGVLDTKVVQKIATTNIIPKRNSHILHGIVYGTISVLAGLYVVLIPQSVDGVPGFIYCLMMNVEITFMLFLILFFLLSLIEMNQLLSSIHASGSKKAPEDLQQLKKNILNDDFNS